MLTSLTGINHFDELRVYKRAYAVAMHVFKESESWPKMERYALTDQIRRSSRGVCANLAEGWEKREYPNYFVLNLSYAKAECSETICWLRFAKDCGYLLQSLFDELDNECHAIAAGLTLMKANPEKWCPTKKK